MFFNVGTPMSYSYSRLLSTYLYIYISIGNANTKEHGMHFEDVKMSYDAFF